MQKSKSRGRPSDANKQEEQKQKLIAATRELMREKSYRSITIREIATLAQINSAMVSYYFDSKEGLVIAAIKAMSLEQFSHFQKLSHSENPLKDYIQLMLQMLNREKGMAKFVHDEILNSESTMRDEFIAGFPKKMAALLPKLIEQEISKRQVQVSINTKYAAFNLVCMLILPFIGAPVRQQAWEISDDELASDEWAEHLYHQFISGCMRTN